jgi:hypothetical protein
MFQNMTDAELNARKGQLVQALGAAAGDERAQIRAEIDDIDDELDRRAREAGVIAGQQVDEAVGNLDEVQNRVGHDAVSAVGRTTERLRRPRNG